MECVLNTRTKIVHFMEGTAELEDGRRFQLVCGCFADRDHLTMLGEPRDGARPCAPCHAHLKRITARFNRMTLLARTAR